ncbi:S-adenosyl-L-methionine-dependent methyltransferase, partial [Baffinella frigidus]
MRGCSSHSCRRLHTKLLSLVLAFGILLSHQTHASEAGSLGHSLVQRMGTAFHTKEYWEKFHRKQGEKPFEWYASLPEFEALLLDSVTSASHPRVLVPGCGDSALCAELSDAGFREVVGLDFSPAAVSKCLRTWPTSETGPRFMCADMTQNNFPPARFDLVIDKGTLDALVSDGSQDSAARGRAALDQAARLLAPGGVLAVVSLLEGFVLDALLGFCAEKGWDACIQAFVPTGGVFLPFLVTCCLRPPPPTTSPSLAPPASKATQSSLHPPSSKATLRGARVSVPDTVYGSPGAPPRASAQC